MLARLLGNASPPVKQRRRYLRVAFHNPISSYLHSMTISSAPTTNALWIHYTRRVTLPSGPLAKIKQLYADSVQPALESDFALGSGRTRYGEHDLQDIRGYSRFAATGHRLEFCWFFRKPRQRRRGHFCQSPIAKPPVPWTFNQPNHGP